MRVMLGASRWLEAWTKGVRLAAHSAATTAAILDFTISSWNVDRSVIERFGHNYGGDLRVDARKVFLFPHASSKRRDSYLACGARQIDDEQHRPGGRAGGGSAGWLIAERELTRGQQRRALRVGELAIRAACAWHETKGNRRRASWLQRPQLVIARGGHDVTTPGAQ